MAKKKKEVKKEVIEEVYKAVVRLTPKIAVLVVVNNKGDLLKAEVI